MTSILLSLTISALVLFTGTEKAPHVDTYKLNKEESSLQWNAKKVTGGHTGTITFSSGVLKHDHGSYSGVFEIDMNTIAVSDLKGSSKTKLENHLKAPDFFDTKNHSSSKLSIGSIRKTSTESGVIYKVTGQLTIKGITHAVAFDANMKEVGGLMRFKGEITVDRTKYDIKYRSGQFFPDIGDKMIYDEFTLKFDVALGK